MKGIERKEEKTEGVDKGTLKGWTCETHNV